MWKEIFGWPSLGAPEWSRLIPESLKLFWTLFSFQHNRYPIDIWSAIYIKFTNVLWRSQDYFCRMGRRWTRRFVCNLSKHSFWKLFSRLLTWKWGNFQDQRAGHQRATTKRICTLNWRINICRLQVDDFNFALYWSIPEFSTWSCIRKCLILVCILLS